MHHRTRTVPPAPVLPRFLAVQWMNAQAGRRREVYKRLRTCIMCTMDGFDLPIARLRVIRGLWSRFVRRAAGAPLTLGYLVVLWAAGIADSRRLTGAPPRFREVAAASVDTFPDTWWTIFSSVLWAPSLVSCIIGSILFLAVGLAFERCMGSLRFGVVALAGHLCGTAAVVLLAVAVEDMPNSWTEALAEGTIWGRRHRLVRCWPRGRPGRASCGGAGSAPACWPCWSRWCSTSAISPTRCAWRRPWPGCCSGRGCPSGPGDSEPPPRLGNCACWSRSSWPSRPSARWCRH